MATFGHIICIRSCSSLHSTTYPSTSLPNFDKNDEYSRYGHHSADTNRRKDFANEN